jgi:hypothetical protein
VLLSEQAKGRMTAETLLKELTISPGSKRLATHLQSVELPSETELFRILVAFPRTLRAFLHALFEKSTLLLFSWG